MDDKYFLLVVKEQKELERSANWVQGLVSKREERSLTLIRMAEDVYLLVLSEA